MTQDTGFRVAPIRVAVRRGLVLTIVLVMVGGLSGAVYSWYRERFAQADAVILVNPLDGNPFSASGSGDSLTNMETEAQLVTSNDVATKVIESTQSKRSADDLIGWVDVNVPTNTQLIQISFRSTNSDEALAIDQAFATDFLASREERARSQVQDQIDSINAQVKSLESDRTALQKKLRTAKAVDAAALTSQIDSVNSQINSLRSRVAELKIGPFNPGQIVTPAGLRQTGPLDSWVTFLALGGLAGLVVALVVALVRARMDNRIHHRDDIALAGRLELGEVTWAETQRAAAEFAAAVPAAFSVAPAFRDLMVSLLTSVQTRPLVLLVASGSSDGAAVPMFAPGLALALMKAELRTVVLDTVGHWAGVAGRQSSHSLEELLSGETAVSELATENLVLISSTSDGDAEDLFMSPSMSRLIRRLRQQADVIMVLTGGVKHSRSRALATSVDAVVTEIVEGISRQDDVRLDGQVLQDKDLGVVYVTAIPSTALGGRRDKASVHDAPRPSSGVTVLDCPVDHMSSEDAVVVNEEAIDPVPADQDQATPSAVGELPCDAPLDPSFDSDPTSAGGHVEISSPEIRPRRTTRGRGRNTPHPDKSCVTAPGASLTDDEHTSIGRDEAAGAASQS